MISKKMKSKLNRQINKEFYSSYLYLSMSAWCKASGYNGAANWFQLQHDEERTHAFKIYNYLLDQGSKIELLKIEQPKFIYTSLLECFEDSLEHERLMTQSFNELSDLAIKEKDHATYGLLQWFVQEQIEEESSVSEIISRVKLVGDGNGLFMIDSELSKRSSTEQSDP